MPGMNTYARVYAIAHTGAHARGVKGKKERVKGRKRKEGDRIASMRGV